MRAFEQALALSEEAARDPVAAVRNARTLPALLRSARSEALGALPQAAPMPNPGDPRLASVLERLTELAEGAGRPLGALAVTHVVRVESIPALTPAFRESGSLKVEWPGGEGVVRSVFAGTLDGNPDTLSRVSVRIAINGSDELFTTGTAAAHVPLVAFQARDHNWFKLRDYAVSSVQRWTVSFNYEEPTGGPAQVRPFLLFGFVRTH